MLHTQRLSRTYLYHPLVPLSSRGPFLLFFLLTVFVSLKGKTVLPPHPAGTAPPLFFSDCFFAASAVVLCWYDPDGVHWFGLVSWKSSLSSVSLVSRGQSMWWNQSCSSSGHGGITAGNYWEIRMCFPLCALCNIYKVMIWCLIRPNSERTAQCSIKNYFCKTLIVIPDTLLS